MDMPEPVDGRKDPFRPGDTVALRSINTFGAHGEAVGFAVAGRVLVDDEALAVVASPIGAAMRRRAGAGSGPNGRLVLPENWDGTYLETEWHGAAVVRVHPRGVRWSVWRWHDGIAWQPEWYINLELPWVRTSIGFDTQDWTLDVIAEATTDGGWSVRYKDEDELAFYVGTGHWSGSMRTVIERAGEDATRTALARRFPFDADWSQWAPDPAWTTPDLPVNWAAIR